MMQYQTIKLVDIFDAKKLQVIQDEFASKMQVASIITYPDGKPFTAPSNFSRLCMHVIRKTPKGLANCIHSDAIIGRFNKEGAIVQPCLSGGLWDAGCSISVGEIHLANWLIGQVMNEAQDIRQMMDYARKIDADVDEFSRALAIVKVMDQTQFVHISEALFLFACYLSRFAKSVLANQVMDDDIGKTKLIALIKQEPTLAKLQIIWEQMETLFGHVVH